MPNYQYGYVLPQGEIILYKGVPLSPDHNDVITIKSNTDGYNKLSIYNHQNYLAESYTRQGKGTLKIGDNADNIMTCNYMCWHSRYNGRYFYAFIVNVEYINENCTEIQYIIDNYMTWFDLIQLGQCFVEREIPETDKRGEHTIDEGIEFGDLVVSFHSTYDFGDELEYLFQASTDIHGQPGCTFVNGIQCPIKYITLPFGSEVTELVNYYHGINPDTDTQENTNNPDNMISVSIVPKFLSDKVDEGVYVSGISEDTFHFARYLDLDGYVPKNNKLYCYPYSRINVSNNSGTITEYKWELFAEAGGTHLSCDFKIIGSVMGNPTILCIPMLYDNVGEHYDYSISMTNFPPLPWINDTYKAFLAQNKGNVISSCIGLVGQIATGTINTMTFNSIAQSSESSVGSSQAMGNAASSAVNTSISAARSIIGMIQEKRDHQFAPKTVTNLAQSDMVMLLSKRMRFDFYATTIKKEMAQSIDNFFSAYGYAINKVKKPNISSRAYWNYTKTNGCVLNGGVPAQAKAELINMFDKGVRFWHEIQNIGNFNLPNEIGGE